MAIQGTGESLEIIEPNYAEIGKLTSALAKSNQKEKQIHTVKNCSLKLSIFIAAIISIAAISLGVTSLLIWSMPPLAISLLTAGTLGLSINIGIILKIII